jgi:hypothetical protein
MYRAIAGILLLIGAGLRAQAGTVIQQQEVDVATKKPGQMVTVYVDAGKLRVEGENPNSGKYIMIFDQAKQVTWMADLSKGTYMEFTQAQVQSMANQMQGMQAQMAQAMQQMQQQMANMPPEQRAQMEQMMKGQMGGMMGMGGASGPPQITVEEKAKGQKVGQFTCTRYDVMSGAQKTEEVCAADISQIKLDAAAFDTFKALAAFYEPLTRNIPKGNWAAPTGLSQIQGFPVQTLVYVGGQPASEWDLVKVESKPIDAGMFVLPPNLQKQEMPSMPSMGGRGMRGM